jgi:hypothetical protein
MSEGNKKMGKVEIMAAVNSPDFWHLWAKAGGDVDEYVKESVPNYGLIGALLITVSLPMALAPPEFDVYGASDDKHYTKGDWEVGLYGVCMNLSTACSMLLIMMSIVIYTQYVNCVDEHTRTAFAKQYAYTIPLLTGVMLMDIIMLMVASIITVFLIYGSAVGVITLLMMAAVGIYFLITVPHMVSWNAGENYGPVVAEKIKEGAEDDHAADHDSLVQTVNHLKHALEEIENMLKRNELENGEEQKS